MCVAYVCAHRLYVSIPTINHLGSEVECERYRLRDGCSIALD